VLNPFLKNNDGNVAIISGIVIGAIGSAIDISNAISHRTNLQDANDASTLAALQIGPNGELTIDEASFDIFNLNHTEP